MVEDFERFLGLPRGALTIEQYPGGYSNLTYLLRAGDQAWVLRRPPPGVHIKSAHDMGREARVLQTVAPHFPKVPKVLAISDAPPFFLMERIDGLIIRKEPVLGVDMRRVSESFVDTLVDIHSVYDASLGRPEGYVERQITGWGERYAKAKTDDVPEATRIVALLLETMPRSGSPSLIHNDYKYDNLVLRDNQVVGVLDWEMATVGDPLMDLGCSLGYWVQADDPPVLQATRLVATHSEGNLTRRQVAERYAAKSGRDLSNLGFYYAFGLFKIAGIAQQLYRRYKDGKSSDPRLAAIGMAVAGYLQMAEHVATTGELDFH